MFNINGHAIFLEEHIDASTNRYQCLKSWQQDDCLETTYNTIEDNLVTQVIGCSPLDTRADLFGDPGAGNSDLESGAGIWFVHPHNRFVGNHVAGAASYGYSWPYTGKKVNLNMCGSATDADPFDDPIDTVSIDYTHLPYDGAIYANKTCVGTFDGNVAHSVTSGFWAAFHKGNGLSPITRLYNFTVYKAQRGIDSKSQGLVEVIGLAAADNATAIWPASHAFGAARDSRRS